MNYFLFTHSLFVTVQHTLFISQTQKSRKAEIPDTLGVGKDILRKMENHLKKIAIDFLSPHISQTFTPASSRCSNTSFQNVLDVPLKTPGPTALRIQRHIEIPANNFAHK